MSNPRDALYELFLHYKQGDDFRHHLDNANGNVSKALRSWASEFRHHYDVCTQLANKLEGLNLGAEADTHYIALGANDAQAEAALEEFAASGVLEKRDMFDEFSDDEWVEEDNFEEDETDPDFE